MISCQRAAELISLSQEGPLRWRQRLALCFHLCACAMCRRFRRQTQLMQRAGERAAEPDRPSAALSEAARDRIKRALREQGGGGAG